MLRPKILILALALSILFFTSATLASIDLHFSRVNDPEGAIIEELDKPRKTIDMLCITLQTEISLTQ